MVAKFADPLPLYRQENILGRTGLPIARSTLAQWVGNTGVPLQPLVDALRYTVLTGGVPHADETPVQMLAPGEKKTHRAMSGPTALPYFRRSRPWCTTSARAGRANMRVTFREPGTASWYAMTLPATKLLLKKGHHLDRLHGACSPQVFRSARGQQKPVGRASPALDWRLVRS